MFIIEKFRNDFEAREKAYDTACKKWIEAGEDANGYNYRGERDYRNKFGESPGRRVKVVLKTVLTAFAVGGLLFLFFGFIKDIADRPEAPVKASAEYKNGEDCKSFKIGDTAVIKYGDYEGAEVEIIGGCENSADYDTRVTKDQVLFADGSSNSDVTDKPIQKGLSIKVDLADNLTKTGHIEPEVKE